MKRQGSRDMDGQAGAELTGRERFISCITTFAGFIRRYASLVQWKQG
jgi:hypothetical protein